MRFARLIHAVDAHAAGEPGRVITGGVLDVPGATMLEKQQHLHRHADHLRRVMLREPRGYPALCANVVLPPTRPEADAGFVIMEQTEYPAMSGSNAICVTTVLIETGMVAVEEPTTTLTLETPAGLVGVRAEVVGGKVRAVTFENVPAFALHLDRTIEVPTLGSVTVDVAWGGMFFVLADATQFGFALTPDEGRDLVRVGEIVKAAAREQLPVAHPETPELAGITIVSLTGPAHGDHADGRNAVVVSTGSVDWERPATWTGVLDRSPCGTGTCARMAVLHAKGHLPVGRPYRHESVLGTVFTGELVREVTVGGCPAVVPTLTGTAWITAVADYVIDPDDPFPEGYTVGDLWGTGE